MGLNNIGNTTLGTELVAKAPVSLPPDTVSLGDQMIWKHTGKKGDPETESLFGPNISEIECPPAWKYIKTLLIKVLLRPILNDTCLGAMCAILICLWDKPTRMSSQGDVTQCVPGYLLTL